MSITIKTVGFVLFLNFAVALILLVGGDSFRSGNTNANTLSEINNLNSTLSSSLASPSVEDTTNFGEKILDFLSLGLYTKVKTFLNNTLFAFPTFLVNIKMIPMAIKTVLDSLMLIMYLAGAFELFTGKKIWGDK